MTSMSSALTPQAVLTKTEAAYHALREAIESGELTSAQRLPVARFERELRMSPTPIREALRMLQAEGLVEHRAHHGMVVATYAAEEVIEIYELRTILEPIATARAVERATELELGEIISLHRSYLAALGGSVRPAEAARLNTAWHEAIYVAAGSRHLLDFIRRLWSAIPMPVVWRSGHAVCSRREHEEIMVAFSARDPARTAELMRLHIEAGAVMHGEQLGKQRSGSVDGFRPAVYGALSNASSSGHARRVP
jgi:DNA-binding GntR family transcriptional regulator